MTRTPSISKRALRNDYSADARKRDLQLEARAHITVQRWIDDGELRDRAVTVDGIREVHRRFCELLPDDLLWVEDPETGARERVVPGALRGRDVKVGEHIAVSPGALPRFLARFEAVYGRLGKPNRFWPPRPRITACSGFILSSMVTAASRG